MNLHACVLHNVSADMFFRYDPETSALHHAHTFAVRAKTIDQAASIIWILTNADSDEHLKESWPHYAEHAEEVAHYRRRRNRSLSVGDVIVFFEGERFAGAVSVASLGFDKIPNFDPASLRVVTNDQPESDESDSYRAHRNYSRNFDPTGVRFD